MEKIFIESGSYAKLQILNGIVRKEASKKGVGKLVDEINWILNLPPELREHFPEIIRYDIDSKIVFSEMKYYPMTTLRRLILERKITVDEALKQLEIIFDFMFYKLYKLSPEEDTTNLVEDVYFNRAKNRIGEMCGLTPLFKKVINTKKIILNGKEFRQVLPILEELENDEELKKILYPPCISYIHGDLHLGNILVEKENPHAFILIDPRGRVYGGGMGGDYAYDLGKLWHSLNGFYDFIHEDKFTLNYYMDNDIINATLNIHEKENLRDYRLILEQIPALLQKYEQIKKDPYWHERTLFSEVIHFCSMLPFHREGDNYEKKPLAIYLRSVILLNEFLEVWNNAAKK
ncbi:hypothetical protein J4456_00645 [Candidatus Pacearchaeota archaeon]|nr:hypothetical protein [Candidatus Pacearchaeota archaeon]